MSSKRFDPDSEGRPEKAAETSGTLGNCRGADCGTVAEKSGLAWRGGLCVACYARYCRNTPATPPIADKRTGGPRAWAELLLERHRRGEKISDCVLGMARRALGMTPDRGSPAGEEFDLRAAREAHDRKLADYVTGGGR